MNISKRLVLFSNPTPSVFEKLDDVLFPEFLSQKVFAYMPADGSTWEENAQYEPIWQKFAEIHGSKFISIDNSLRGKNAQYEKDKILSANILMITGGNTYTLMDHLRKSGLDSAILEFWKKPGVVLAGFSAGAIVLTPSIEVAKTGDINEVGLSDLRGLNLIDFEVWPHYEKSHDSEIAEYRGDNPIELKLISDEELLVIDV
jgi:dipeptidase E